MARYGLSLQDALRCTLAEYQLYALAFEIQRNDRQYDIALQAWMNQGAKATKGKGKNTRSKYRDLEQFYPYKKNYERIIKGNQAKTKILSLADKNKQLRNLGKGGT